MLKKVLQRMFKAFRGEGLEQIETPKDRDAAFVLWYGTLPVGRLTLHAGTWVFEYSPQFKAQDRVNALVDFPSPDKVYRAEQLWPFFMARIPSLSQPQVEAAVVAEGIDRHSDVDLLRRFGERTIANPFVLQETG